MKNKKIKAYERGHLAERLAAAFLMLKGYRILNRRYKTPVGEIDIVAKRGNVIVMVEVKQRREMGAALESITMRNQYRVAQASKYYLAVHPGYCGMDLRFDVIVMGWPFFLAHLDNAWDAHT